MPREEVGLRTPLGRAEGLMCLKRSSRVSWLVGLACPSPEMPGTPRAGALPAGRAVGTLVPLHASCGAGMAAGSFLAHLSDFSFPSPLFFTELGAHVSFVPTDGLDPALPTTPPLPSLPNSSPSPALASR